jgi:hypothetical protein
VGSVGSGARVVGATTATVELVVDAENVVVDAVDAVSDADGTGSLPAVAGSVVADSLPHAPTPIISATIAFAERHIGLTISMIPLTPYAGKGRMACSDQHHGDPR